ncbi:hypothetical protein [Bradyrhizobium sp. CCBAU 11386]|uniref:hypothetical protein n=1 Tax=Bradyrhizobium sp. CCBAU 11386 TaxID=1630837 RepID=UPI00230380F3|nr:hypothetical protein [Bradyrhizobium sp. CCBAU 11386]
MKSNRFAATMIAGLMAVSAGSPVVAQEASTTRIKIASAAHRENGCSESSKNFKIVVPNADKLDLNYKGVVAGIERVYTEGNGTRSDGDYAFADNGNALTFRLWVKGGGTRISGFGRNVCHRATGANTAIDFYGHYKR